MNYLDGKSVAEAMYTRFAEQTNAMDNKPCLAVILVGDDPASHVYVSNKEKSCAKAGIISQTIRLSKSVSEEEVLKEVHRLNQDPQITGMIVQVPLPSHISEEKVLYAIDPKKDMDGFHPSNLGEMYLSKTKEFLPPATPSGIISLLEYYNIPLEGSNVVVVGRSNNVGKAVSLMLLNRNATVSICHSRTKNITEYTKKADIVIVAVGIPNFLKGEMVKNGVVLVDVGIHRIDTGLCGDIDIKSLNEKALALTPVPGGVGPMTVASLIENTLTAHLQNK